MHRLALLLGIQRADDVVVLLASADRSNKLDTARDTAVALSDTYKKIIVVPDVGEDAKIISLNLPAPVNTVAPAITGTAQEGQVLSCSTGTWTHTPTFTRQWKKDGTAIAGATGATYTAVTGDIGGIITCSVTAINSGGSASQLSNATTAVLIAAPVNTLAPAITGTAQDGQVLSCSTGTWTHSPTFGRQWKKDGVNIGGATGATYTAVTGDVGGVITCLVTATNAGGSASQLSNATAAVIAA